MDQSSTSQNRRSRRSNVLLAATIEAWGTVIPVKLRNLSPEGALIEGDNLPVEGSEVLFQRNDIRVKSRVAWLDHGQAGIAFNRTLKPQDVLRNIPTPRPRAFQDFRRPGLACREMSPDERRLVESWVRFASRDGMGE